MCQKCKLITLLRLEKLSMSDNTEDPKYQVTINATARKKAPQISIFFLFMQKSSVNHKVELSISYVSKCSCFPTSIAYIVFAFYI